MSPEGNLQLAATFVGLSVYAVVMTAAWQLFARALYSAPAFVGNVLDMAVLASVAGLGYIYYARKTSA